MDDFLIFLVDVGILRIQMTSIFEGQPSKTGSFSCKTRVIWVLGIPGIPYMDPMSICFFRNETFLEKVAWWKGLGEAVRKTELRSTSFVCATSFKSSLTTMVVLDQNGLLLFT